MITIEAGAESEDFSQKLHSWQSNTPSTRLSPLINSRFWTKPSQAWHS